MKYIRLVGVLILIVLISGCTSPEEQAQPTQPVPTQTQITQPSPTQTLAVQPETTETMTVQPVSVQIKDFKFNPATITIKKGTTVTWTQEDAAPHTVTIKTGQGFDSGTLSQGQTFGYTFNETGTFEYGCSIHPSMSGTVIVT